MTTYSTGTESENKIAEIIKKLFMKGTENITLLPEMNLLTEGIMDSLGMAMLAAELEKSFHPLQIQDQDLTIENFSSVRSINLLIKQKIKDFK